MPFWELASTLEDLSIDRGRCIPPQTQYDEESKEYTVENLRNVSETELSSFELPSPSVPFEGSKMAKDTVVNSILCRTIIEAARGGQLRRLYFAGYAVQEVFSIRSLLPHWVNVVEWKRWYEKQPGEDWLGAAMLLRPILYHASFWLPGPITGARYDRTLTPEEVRSLPSHFARAGLPVDVEDDWAPWHRRSVDFRPISLYLPWLDDAELSQRVSEAWNGAVSRGEADAVKCLCTECDRDVRVSPWVDRIRKISVQ